MKYKYNFDFDNVEVKINNNGFHNREAKVVINGNLDVEGNIEGIGINDILAIIKELKK